MARQSIAVSDDLMTSLKDSASEHHRTIGQEINYRLDQAMKLNQHISNNQVGLIQVLAKMYEGNGVEDIEESVDDEMLNDQTTFRRGH